MANTGNNQRSGSDTASAANIASVTTGSAGQPGAPQSGQSATLASHTSRPMGGSQTGSGQSSQGPEHLRHQDKDAGKGLGSQGAGGGQSGQSGSGSAMDTARQAAQSAGETVRDAVGQASQAASQAAGQATEWARNAASGVYEQGARQFETVRRSMPDVRQYGGSVQRFVAENPILVGVVGLATGLLLGALLPRTRREDQVFGRWADEVREQGLRYARDMTQRGREYVEEAFGDEDDRFASPDMGRERSGPAGRFQNH